MRYIASDVMGDWELVQVARPGGRGTITSAFAKKADRDLLNAYAQLRLLRARGAPPPQRGFPDCEEWKGKCSGDASKAAFWVLKCKPGRWRLYFCTPDSWSRRITFLLAVEKKRNERDPNDFEKLCNLARKLAAGELDVIALDIPDGA